MLLYLGYFNDLLYLAFEIGYLDQRPGVIRADKPSGKPTHLFELIVNIVMSTDIFLNFITAFYRDMKPVKNLFEIFKNYASGYMILDMAATFPGFFLEK